MLSIAIANHKGGVGKTATAHALGDILSSAGRRALLVDIDPQGSLSRAAGYRSPSPSLVDVLTGAAELPEAVRAIRPGLDIVPAHIDLAKVELWLAGEYRREYRLKDALAAASGYELAIIDCPTSVGLLTVNGLAAADGVLIPTQPQAADLAGLELFLSTISKLQGGVNPGLEIVGIVPTFYDSRYLAHQEAIEAMQAARWPLLDSRIGRTVKIAEAAREGLSIAAYDPKNTRAAEYRQLAGEVEAWLKTRNRG